MGPTHKLRPVLNVQKNSFRPLIFITIEADPPLFFLQDVDEDEVAELISSSCRKNVTAQLIVPMLPAAARRRLNQTDLPKLEKLHVQMEESQFKYDVTWFSQHFHELDQVKKASSPILGLSVRSP